MSEVHVRLKMAGLSMEFRGDEASFQRAVGPLLLRIASGGSRAAALAPAPSAAADVRPVPRPAPVRSSYRPPSDLFGIFERQLDPTTNGPANRIAAYAFFLWNYEKKDVFREEEVAGCFEAEGMAVPEDTGTLFDDLSRQRILAPAAQQGTWRLTPKGRDHVREHLLSA